MTTKPRKSGDRSAPADIVVEAAPGAARADDAPRGGTTRAVGEGVSAVWVHLDALKPNPRNPRIHGPEKLLLARTILRTRWGAPVLVQRSTMRIIGGHGRREAALEIMAGVEVDGILRGGADHLLDPDAPGPGMVPCRVLDCSDAEADALTLADNARRLQGKDDPAALVAMASHAFTRDAPTMADMGFGGADLDALVANAGDALLAGAGGAESGEAADDAPAASDEKRKAFVGGYAVAVMCNDEAHQQEIFERLQSEGFDNLKVLAR